MTTPLMPFHHFVDAVSNGMQKSDAFGWSNGGTFIPRTFTLDDGSRVKGFDWLKAPEVRARLGEMWNSNTLVDAAVAAMLPIAREAQKQRVDPAREREYLRSRIRGAR